jgi:transposase
MLRMDQVYVIRHKVLVEGQSARAVARQMGVSRNTVRKYLQVSAPVRRERRARARPVLEAVAARMEALLEQWGLRSTAKQRVTGARLHQELVEEGLRVGVTTVRSYCGRGGGGRLRCSCRWCIVLVRDRWTSSR